jgi:hypothetical protein
MQKTNEVKPPSYNELTNDLENRCKGNQINNLLEKYEIDQIFSEKLSILEDFEIVLLLDDSGSMNTPLSNSQYATRWEELKSVVKIIFEISMIFDEDGIDIHFLNRQGISNVKTIDSIQNILEITPAGRTPLTKKCNMILQQYANSAKPVLLLIATDGLPTNNTGYDTAGFEKCLKTKNHDKFYISFLACSDQDSDVGYLNKLDKEVPNIDTLDDYNSELLEVLAVQGQQFRYTLGDHVVRLLLGPICPELDGLDEYKIKNKRKFCLIS